MKDHISVSALSYYLQIRTPVLLQFIRQERLEQLLSGNHINYRDVPQLLVLYTSKHGFQNRKWEIPAWLTAKKERWSEVLIDMYGEDVSSGIVGSFSRAADPRSNPSQEATSFGRDRLFYRGLLSLDRVSIGKDRTREPTLD